MDDSVAVAIVSYNAQPELRRCLETVVRERPRSVVVVDNASIDGNPDLVRKDFPDVALIANAANAGFGAAANDAIAACRGEFVLLLNCDTALRAGTVAALSAYLRTHPSVAVVGPRLVRPDGKLEHSSYPFLTPLQVLVAMTGLNPLLARVPGLRRLYLSTAPHDRARAVPWVKGAALAIRRSAFEQVGGFDTGYFLYAEELDLCYRLWNGGWEIHFTPDATVEHVGGASTREHRAESEAQLFRSLIRFYRIHYPPARLVRLRIVVAAIAIARKARDRIRLRYARDPADRAAAAEGLAAWEAVLRLALHPAE